MWKRYTDDLVCLYFLIYERGKKDGSWKGKGQRADMEHKNIGGKTRKAAMEGGGDGG